MPDLANASTEGKTGTSWPMLCEKAAGALEFGFGQGYELTGLCIAGQFVYVKGVNCAHAAKTCNCDFEHFSHRISRIQWPALRPVGPWSRVSDHLSVAISKDPAIVGVIRLIPNRF